MNWKFLFTWNLCKSLRTLNVIKNNSTVTTTSSFLKCERQLCKHKHFFWVFQMISQFCENFQDLFHLKHQTSSFRVFLSANCQLRCCPFIADYFVCKLSLILFVGLWLLRLQGDECATKKKRKTSKFTLESSTNGITHSSHGLSSDN